MLKYGLLSILLITPSGLGCTTQDDVAYSGEPIIGGVEAAPGNRPWQAQLQIPGYAHWCGGTLIHEEWILTAAHCTYNRSASDFTVVLGEHDRSVAEGTEQTRGVSEIIIHPNYPSQAGHDVALLHLSTPVSFTDHVQVIALTRFNDAPGQIALATGWGNTSPGSGASDILMEASLPVRPNADCDSAPNLSRDLVASELCAGFLDGEQGGCHGDSGGPLVSNQEGEWGLIGVVSWGQGHYCGTYTVFARVSSFVEWTETYIPLDAESPNFDPAWMIPINHIILN